jgi:predicted Zn-dependent protease
MRDEAELAGVLGHEIGHVDGKHGVEQYSQQTLVGGAMIGAAILAPKTQPFLGISSPFFQLLFLKHGRGAELESDGLGVRYAAQTGWAPRGMEGVLQTLGRLDEAQGSRRGVPNGALSHPPAEERVTRIQEHVAAAASSGATTTNAAEFERRIDRIVVGDSREKGMVRGSEFVHPVLRFTVRFPEGWDIVNGSTQVSAAEGDSAGAAMVLELSKNVSGSVAQAARADMSGAGLVEVSGGATRINGLDAYVGVYEGVIENTRVAVRAAHIRSGEHIYLVAGLTRSSDFSRADRAFMPALESFRALSQAEADRIQPNRLAFYVVRQGDTWESLASRAGAIGAPRPASLAIMNGSEPGTPPRVGARVRIVVGG